MLKRVKDPSLISSSKAGVVSTKPKGQITVFAGLFFVVLFVLFASMIHIGLVVYDKINLQNSLDLATYYVAQRQAEMMNAVGHSNYQIRQAYKLLTFRYRVIGSHSIVKTGSELHPAMDPNYNPNGFDTPLQAYNFEGMAEHPFVCLYGAANRSWFREEISGADLCQYMDDAPPTIPALVVPGGASSFIFNQVATNVANLANQGLGDKCQIVTFFNWFYTSSIFTSYRFDQASRREVIEKIKSNLEKPIQPGGMLDLYGESVYDGALKTFESNLTRANRRGFDPQSLIFKNSLQGQSNWLVPIYIDMLGLYARFVPDPNPPFACLKGEKTAIQDPAFLIADLVNGNSDAEALLTSYDPNQNLQGSAQTATHLSVGDEVTKTTIGYEKNPWIMVYAGAKVSVSNKTLFSPIFARSLELKARTFAKPFGSTIGPWYGKNWSSGAPQSDSTIGSRVDELLPPRFNPGGGAASYTPAEMALRYPNYSKYPGDTAGMKSRVALGAIDLRAIPSTADQRAIFGDYVRVWTDLWKGESGDPLVHRKGLVVTGPTGIPNIITDTPYAPLRRIEMASVKPDVFDAVYYNIEPNFWDNYVENPVANGAGGAMFLNQNLLNSFALRPDIGGNFDGADLKDFSLLHLLDISPTPSLAAVGKVANHKGFWAINDGTKAAALINSWKGEVFTGAGYDFQGTMNTAKCDAGFFQDDEDLSPQPGSCKSRSNGYSVKLVSRSYLLKSNLNLGGSSGSMGPILNPPTGF